MKAIRPVHVFLTVLSVMLLLTGLARFFPEDGVDVYGYTLRFKSLRDYYEEDSAEVKVIDVEKLLAERDSMAQARQVQEDRDSVHVDREETITSIQFKDQNSHSLHSFFEAVENTQAEGLPVHVLHYGDSQIEGDRMSNILRAKLQEKFGGRGPGLISPVPLVGNASVTQTWSKNWSRYTSYGYEDQKAAHNRFGVMGAYGRYGDIGQKSEDTTEAWIEFAASSMAKSTARSFDRMIVFAGNCPVDVDLELRNGDSLIDHRVLKSTEQIERIVFEVKGYAGKLKLVFRSLQSPDVHAISLESAHGVLVDNIAWRGSSGTNFKKISASELSAQMSALNTGLIILQFGGNSVPALTSKEGAQNYARYFRSQIQYIKKLAPQASVLVIGPSDMSTSVDGEYRTWPYLEDVRDAMREAAWQENCGFWDMYAVMGGENSMVSWVAQNYAGADYTHFTPSGARRMAELFCQALLSEYNAWKESKSKL